MTFYKPYSIPNDNNGSTQTKFNASLSKLERIHIMHSRCHDIRTQRTPQSFYIWFDTLVGIRSELDSKMKKEERTKAQEIEKEIDTTLKQKQEQIRRQQIIGAGTFIISKDPRRLLNEYELFLGRIENAKGMGLIDKSSGDEAMEV